MTEADFLAATESVTERLTSRFAALFGGPDDFAQEVVLWSLEAVRSFDPARGALGGLLYRTARNWCLNRIRDRVQRADPPCKSCHAGAPCRDGQVCKRYAAWQKRNDLKANLFRPLPMGDQPDRGEGLARYTPDVEGVVLDADLMRFIDERLPAGVRGDYLRLMAGETGVSPCRRAAVRRAVAAILSEAGLPVPGEKFTDDDADQCLPHTSQGDPWWAELPPLEDVDEQEEGRNEEQAPVGIESVRSTIIPESFDVALSGLSSSAA